ncbi:MAG: DUF2062 domain-containing protein [Holophagaceae bacterium]|nr:DUF2062 domain-containing protein [Holophagaceae bacterium]
MSDAPGPPGPPASPAQVKPSKGLYAKLKLHILHPDLSAESIAWSFALGLAVAFNPLLGMHTVMILLFCALFRGLHRPLMFLAAFINNPWTMVPIATASAYLGNFLRGRGMNLDLSTIHWREIGWRSFVTWQGFEAMHDMLRPVLKSYLFGGMLLSLLAIPAGYWAMLVLARRMRRIHFHHSHGGTHGHAIPDEAGPGHAGETGGSPEDPAR